MTRERRERDRSGTSRALGVLFVVLPWALIQALMGLVGSDADGRTERDCDLRYDPDLLAIASFVALALALLALLLAWPRPRLSIRLAAVAAFVSLCYLVAGGWSAAGCTIG